MKRYGNPWVLIFFIISGVVLGGLISTSLSTSLPILSYGPGPLGLKNFELNLGFVYINLSFLIDINISNLIGLLLSILLYNKL